MRRLAAPLFLLIAAFSLIVLATFNGVIQPDTRLIGVGVTIVVAGLAVGLHLTRPALPLQPLESAIALWLIAFALSTLANPSDGERIGIGLWFAGAYVLVIAVVSGGLARRWWRAATLIDALLIVGAVALFFGAAQRAAGAGLPVSFLGNTNSFGLLLVVIIPLAIGRMMSGRRLSRPAMTLYAIAAFALLVMTGSRGALLGGLAGAAAWVALSGYAQRARLLPVWRGWPVTTRRALAIGGAACAIAVTVIGGIAFARTFGTSGRTLDLRTWIYETAIATFADQPLTGAGLFTFGGELAARNSTPLREPHSHAHNLILHTAAELGLPGLLALAATGWIALRAGWRGLRAADPTAIAVSAALIGVGVHTLFDMPLMMPTLMLMTLLALIALIGPGTQQTMPSAPMRAARLAVIGAIAGFVVIAGTGNALRYRQTIAVLTQAVTSREYAAGAAQIPDDGSTMTASQRGMLLALANDHAGAAAAYALATARAPHDSILWINLAATRLAAGDRDGAIAAVDRALTLAPDMRAVWGVIRERAADPAYVSPAAFPLGDNPTGADYPFGANGPYGQYLHLVIPRVFVPQMAVP